MCQGIRTQAASTKCESSIRFERSRNRWIKPAGSSSAVLNQYASEPYHRTVSEELSSDLPDARFSSGDAIKIHNWPDSESITDDTPLVRYMKLGTFLLLLLGNQMFLPTLRLLQNSDRSEGNAPLVRASFYDEKMWPIVSAHQDRLLNRSNRAIPPAVNEVRDQLIRVLTIESWREQLAVRRCVSCWNRSTRQIDFMWKIYGDRGVAVFSTVGRVRRALAEAGAEGIVSPVLYIPIEDTIPKPDFDLLCANCSRPYLFKNWSFWPRSSLRDKS